MLIIKQIDDPSSNLNILLSFTYLVLPKNNLKKIDQFRLDQLFVCIYTYKKRKIIVTRYLFNSNLIVEQYLINFKSNRFCFCANYINNIFSAIIYKIYYYIKV